MWSQTFDREAVSSLGLFSKKYIKKVTETDRPLWIPVLGVNYNIFLGATKHHKLLQASDDTAYIYLVLAKI